MTTSTNLSMLRRCRHVVKKTLQSIFSAEKLKIRSVVSWKIKFRYVLSWKNQISIHVVVEKFKFRSKLSSNFGNLIQVLVEVSTMFDSFDIIYPCRNNAELVNLGWDFLNHDIFTDICVDLFQQMLPNFKLVLCWHTEIDCAPRERLWFWLVARSSSEIVNQHPSYLFIQLNKDTTGRLFSLS